MQLKYNRKPSLGTSIVKIIIKLLIAIAVFIFVIFLIEKVNFPSPQKKFEIDITNDVKKL